ncbi:MBL fold metallo-hydrolase [bacterium]|nr:MBL fold metallo-hydrolase [bacterium]
MIQPIQQGQALLDDIHNTHPTTGQIALWWLGQSGFAVKTASAQWYVDLYLSEHLTVKYAHTDLPHVRMTEAPLRGADITEAALVFASHKHSDHLDPGTLPDLLTVSPQARLILPAATVDHAVALGLPRERLIPTHGDETLTFGSLTVHVLPSAHPALDFDQQHGYPYLGFVFVVDGVRVYHSGDTVIYPGLAERLADHAPDILLLPINGQHAGGRVAPNMTAAEAVALG